MNDTTELKSITLEYDLYNLPTAQHKAGLVGLLLMVESMKMRKMGHIPEVEYQTTHAKISFTKESLQALFDDLYDASWVEIESRVKWKGKTPKRTIAKEIQANDDKKKTETRFIYDAVQPKGAFLQTLYSGNEVWLKLWRDMLWTTLRGIPTTRNIYEERAEHKRSSMAQTVKRSIEKAREDEGGKSHTESIASSVYIGAQDVNAEKVPFQGQTEQNLLLHFWPLASLTYVPRKIGVDGKIKDSGYVLAIPEPANLSTSVEDIKNLLRSLPSELSGFRPRGALIDLPAEGGLEYLYHLAHYRVKQTDMADSLVAIEIYHVGKQGNSIHTLAAERILPNADILEDYDALRKDCRNPLFKAQRIKNLLSGSPWHHGMDTLFNQYPWEFFIQSGDSPHTPFFGYDVWRKLQALENQIQFKKGGDPLDIETGDDHLALYAHRLIREYVNRRTEAKSGEKYDDFKNQKDDKGRIKYPQKYREAREKICNDAFLAIRGRRDQDFIEYFTGTICSVPQYLPEKDYLAVSQALLTDWEKVKTMAMLALSAASAVGRDSE